MAGNLDGGVGADTLMGGAGDDVYYVDDAGDVVIEASGEGTDRVSSTLSYVLGENIENLTLSGTSDINGTGNSQNNIVSGNAGNNILDGGEGTDSLYAGAGNDVYLFNIGDGVDTICDSGGVDMIHFGVGIDREDVAIFSQNNNLIVAYSNDDRFTISQQAIAATSIEWLELADGSFLTTAGISQINQSMAAFAISNGLTISSVDDVLSNPQLMGIVAAAWEV